MGVSRSPEALAAKLTAFARAIEDGNESAVTKAAFAAKVRILAEAAKAVGTDNKMGTKTIGVRFTLHPTRDGFAAEVRPTGPMHWLERGVKPHAIAPKGAGGSRATRSAFVAQAFGSGPISFGRGRIKVLQFADGRYRPYARKAGRFPAKQTWSNGTEAAIPLARQAFTTEQAKALVSSFR